MKDTALAIYSTALGTDDDPEQVSLDFNGFSAEVYGVAVSKGWYAWPLTFGEAIALIHSELSELLQDFRDHKAPTEVYFRHDKKCPVAANAAISPDEMIPVPACCIIKPEGVPIELADVIIRCGDLAGYYGIDMDQALDVKRRYNRTRTPRHGGKAL